MPPRHSRPLDHAAVARMLVAWYRGNRRDLPWRRTRDPYGIWLAEMMLQQTTVRAVIPYYGRFMTRFPDLPTLARARLSSVLTAWSGLGYYRRARHLHEAARRILREHAGRFPRRLEELLLLPGIGRYTAGAILSIAFDQPRAILDGNVERVLSRLLCLRGDPRTSVNNRRLWEEAGRLVNASDAPGDLNQGLMELGATVCTPSTPDCADCPVTGACRARAERAQAEIPPARRRRAPEPVTMQIAMVERRGRILMQRRSGTGTMEGLWELPVIGSTGPAAPVDGLTPLKLRRLNLLTEVKHTITYRRIAVEVYRARLLSEPRGESYRWVAAGGVGDLPTSSLVGKVLRNLGD